MTSFPFVFYTPLRMLGILFIFRVIKSQWFNNRSSLLIHTNPVWVGRVSIWDPVSFYLVTLLFQSIHGFQKHFKSGRLGWRRHSNLFLPHTARDALRFCSQFFEVNKSPGLQKTVMEKCTESSGYLLDSDCLCCSHRAFQSPEVFPTCLLF